jgi:hypothetical protein
MGRASLEPILLVIEQKNKSRSIFKNNRQNHENVEDPNNKIGGEPNDKKEDNQTTERRIS